MDNDMHKNKTKDAFEAPSLKLENEDLPAPGTKPAPKALTADDASDDRAKKKGASQSSGFPIRSFNAGDVIFREGEPGDAAYLILDGQVKITRQHKEKSIVVNELGKGQIFGEMAIIAGDPRAATAEATVPTELFFITESRLNENLSQHLAIVKSLIDQLVERMKQLLKQQTTFVSKVEQAMQKDKKLAQLKEKAAQYAQARYSNEVDEELQQLLEMIIQL